MKKLVPLLLFLVSMPTMAQRQFDIEVIIFKRAVDAEKTSESWPAEQSEIDLSVAGQYSNSEYLELKEVTLLPREEYHLTDQAKSLTRHAGFNVLLHKAWRQGDEGKSSSPVFHIQAGRDYSEQFNPNGSEKIAFIEESPVEGVVEETYDRPLYELDGKLQIYVQHYLYAETQLDIKSPSVRKIVIEDAPIEDDIITEELNEALLDTQLVESPNVLVGNMKDVTPTVEVEEYLKSYRMDQKRRMRSTETHYLDHPLLGIIIQVRRVEQS